MLKNRNIRFVFEELPVSVGDFMVANIHFAGTSSNKIAFATINFPIDAGNSSNTIQLFPKFMILVRSKFSLL